jgi:aryl-alcohol dehydrogenase-like predicted oxidoreductase
VKQIESGQVPPEMRKEAIEELMKLLEDERERERILRAIYSRLRRLLTEALLYYMDRYPEEDIDLPMGSTRTIFHSEVNKIKITLKYVDSLNNKYPQLKRTIDINDERENKTQIFQAPLNITWKREPFDLIGEE